MASEIPMAMYGRKDGTRDTAHFCHMVCGRFEQDEEIPDEEEEEEEDEDIQFLNYHEMNGVGQGKQLFEGRKMKKCQGVLVDLDRPNIRNQVIAPFHFIDTWWKLTILRTKFDTYKKSRFRYPKDMTCLMYKIRQDDKVVKDKLVNLFLTQTLTRPRKDEEGNIVEGDTGANDFIDEFLQFVQNSGNSKNLKFEHLEELLESFSDFLPDDRQISADRVKGAFHSPEWACISKALQYPKLVSLLSQLLPNQFKSIMESPQNEALMDNLNKALEIKPWVFGYKKLLYKDYDLTGCEATLLSIQRAEIFEKLEQVHKDALVIYDFLKLDTRKNGHTQIALLKLKNKMHHQCRQFEEALKFLKRNKITKEIEIEGDVKICLKQLWDYERKISEGVSLLFNKQIEDPMEIDVDLESCEFDQIRGDREQFQAANMLLKHPVVVISGKGGCGKTTVVTKVLSADSNKGQEIIENKTENSTDECDNSIDLNGCEFSQKTRQDLNDSAFPDSQSFHDHGTPCCSSDDPDKEPEDVIGPDEPTIIYTAPTGKAANLLGRRAKRTGYTLHQIIWNYRFFITKMQRENPDAKWKFRHVKTLVVDECSMVAVSTFSTLLTTLIKNANLRKVVLLGDIRQLPSIEPGNFLADIYRSMMSVNASIELMTNHRAESNLIVHNATAISLKQYPLFSREERFVLHEVPESNDKNSDMHDIVVQRILKNEECLQDDKRSQFVSFTRKDCDLINEHACQFYNKHPTRNYKKRQDFQVNDKICLGKNGLVRVYDEDENGRIRTVYLEGELEPEQAADVMEVTLMSQTLNDTALPSTSEGSGNGEKKKKTAATIRLCNGEIYFIKADHGQIDNRGKGERYLKFSDEDKDCPRELWVNYKEVMRKCKMKHSWARTIHTFQGSECENLVYVVGSCWSQNWQHVYTAVTRGKKAVHIVGIKCELKKAIQRDPTSRNTTLHHQLQNNLPLEQIHEKLEDGKDGPEASTSSQQNYVKMSSKSTEPSPSGSKSHNDSGKMSTSTPMSNRNGFTALKKIQPLDSVRRSMEDQPHSPFSDSQWSDYGDDTYIEATQQCTGDRENNENSFDLMDSLEMSESSELIGDLTAACELVEADLERNPSGNSQSREPVRCTFLNYQTKGDNNKSKGSNSSLDSVHIDEVDSSPEKKFKNSFGESVSPATPQKQTVKDKEYEVSPTRRRLTQLTFV